MLPPHISMSLMLSEGMETEEFALARNAITIEQTASEECRSLIRNLTGKIISIIGDEVGGDGPTKARRLDFCDVKSTKR